MEKDINVMLEDLGVRRFIRTRVVAIFKDSADGKTKPQDAIARINAELVRDFVVIAQDELNKIMEDAKVLMREKGKSE